MDFDAMYLWIGDWFQYNTQWDEFLDTGYFSRPCAVAYEPTGDSVPTNTVIVVWVSEPIGLYYVALYPTGQPGNWVEGDVYYNESENKLEFVPRTELLPGTNYTVEVDFYDFQGNYGGVYWQFTTAGEIPEFPSILTPTVMLLALALVFRTRMVSRKSR